MVRTGRPSGRRAPQILVVCTGNVCRSPYISAVIGAAHPGFVLRSAGTAALRGAPATPEIVAGLRARGVPADKHAARQVTRDMMRRSLLVITATRAQRVFVTGLASDAAARTFTLKELARLLPGAADDAGAGTDLADVLADAAAASHAEKIDHDDDLADPYGLGSDAYLRMFAEVGDALDAIVPTLVGSVW